MKKKSNKLNLIICGIAFVVMVVYLFFVDGVDNLLASLQNINPLYLVIAVLFMAGYWLCEAWGLHIAVKSLDKNVRFGTTLLVAMIGQYFNCITPCASGGQPMQAYAFVKRGLSLGSAMTALLSRFIVYQLMLTIYSVIFLVFKLPLFMGGSLQGLTLLVIIGFIVNTAVILFLLMLAFFRKPVTKLAHGIIKLLGKLRIIKNPEEKTAYIDEELEQYYQNFMFIKHRPVLLVRMCLVTAVQLILYFGITYIIYRGFGMSEADFFTIVACQAFVLMISSFVPLPGALGAAEGSYAAFFGGIFGEYTGFSTFIWRFLTFYLPIIIGIVINIKLSKSGIDLSKSEAEIKAASENIE